MGARHRMRQVGGAVGARGAGEENIAEAATVLIYWGYLKVG